MKDTELAVIEFNCDGRDAISCAHDNPALRDRAKFS